MHGELPTEPDIPIDLMVSSIYGHVAKCRPNDFSDEEKKTKPLTPRTIAHSYRKVENYK